MNPTAIPLPPTDLQSAIVHNPLTASPETTVGAAIAQMAALRAAQTSSGPPDISSNDLRDNLHNEARAGCVFVVAGEQFLGMVTERDIVRLSVPLFHGWSDESGDESGDESLNSAFAFDRLTLGAVMTSPSVTVRESALPDWGTAVTLLQQQGHPVPVLKDDGRIVGMLTLATLLAQTVIQLATEHVHSLENHTVRLEQQLEQQVEQRTAAIQSQANREALVHRIALCIRQSLDVEAILATAVTEVRQFLSADRVVIYQFQPDMSGTIVAEAVLPGWTASLGVQIKDTCFQENAGGDYRMGKRRAIANIYQAGLTPCHVQLLERFEVKANLVAPILVWGHLWGLLVTHQCADFREWQGSDLDLLDQLVVQLAIALQQAATYQQAQDALAERQRIEISLRASEQRYATLAEISPVGMFKTDAAGQCLYVNERWCQMSGLTLEQALGWGWVQGIHPEDRELVANTWNTAARENHPYRLEYRFQNADGQITWVFGQALAERTAAGELVGYVGTVTDISDRKQAEAEHLQAEQVRQELNLLETILDIILAGYWDWDLETNFEYFSPGLKRMFGYEEDELPNRPETWQRLIFREDLPGVLRCFDRHVQSRGQVPFYNEVRYHHRDGSTVWVICSGQVIQWDAAGRPLRMVGCHIDISDRKQAEEQLRKSDAHLKTAQRISRLGSWEFDPRTQEITWSEEVFSIFGRNPKFGPPTFESLQQQLLPRDRAYHQQVVQEAIETVCSYEIEYQFYRLDGALRHIQARGEPIVDASGQLTYLVGTVLDITDRKQTEEKLRSLSDRLTLAAKAGAIGIWDWNVPENILTWDDQMYALYGLISDQFTNIYEAWANRLHPDDRALAETAIQQALTGEKEYNLEFRIVQADGTVRFIKAAALVQRDAQGEAQRMIGINYDVTDQKLAALKLAQTTAQLAASNQELEAFAYSVSHDLRSPLRAIDGFSRALMEDYGDQVGEEGKDYFDRIRKNVTRMSMLIDDLLRLSRVSRSDMQYSNVNLSALVQEQVQELQTLEPERQVTVIVKPGVVVFADVNLMRVVISNLLQNAWKFTSHHPTAHIEFGVIPHNEQPTYFIRDDGAGFNMAYTNMLFGVFQRLHNTHEFPGTGIGLATVQRVIHRHGGRVWAEGAIEQGATLYFTIPNTSTSTRTGA
jgi:PAS domain S-box-containing protein